MIMIQRHLQQEYTKHQKELVQLQNASSKDALYTITIDAW